jgi:hypothetical protein
MQENDGENEENGEYDNEDDDKDGIDSENYRKG